MIHDSIPDLFVFDGELKLFFQMIYDMIWYDSWYDKKWFYDQWLLTHRNIKRDIWEYILEPQTGQFWSLKHDNFGGLGRDNFLKNYTP